jgi:hypothetical protein
MCPTFHLEGLRLRMIILCCLFTDLDEVPSHIENSVVDKPIIQQYFSTVDVCSIE